MILALPKDLHDSLTSIVTRNVREWVDDGVELGLCDFYHHSRDPAFRVQAVKEKVLEASRDMEAYEFVYQTPSTVTYHFFFVAASEEELRDRLSVVQVMAL